VMADRPAAAAIAAALLAVSAAAETASRPGSAAPLLEATAPGGEIIVFVPSGSANGRFLVSTTNDAAAYRRWAEESRPGKGIALRWDSEPFEMDVADRTLLAWIREGDEGTDPAGRFRYAVVSNPVPATGRVALLLKNPPAPKDFAPDCCASNVWLLSRDTLFARWEECAKQQGGAADVRRAFRSLDRRFGSSPEWRAAADDFAAKMPDLRAAVRFRNEKDSAVRIRIDGTPPKTLAAGETWPWTAPAGFRPGPVSWEARDIGDGRSSDDDWTWSPTAEIAGFDPMGEDVDVPLSGPYGSLKPLPFLEFADGDLPDGAVRAELQYADGGREPVQVVARNGRPAVECEPGRRIRQCVVRLDGWTDGVFAPEGGIDTIARDRSLKLKPVGALMKRNLPPWRDGAVRIAWNGHEGKVRLRVEAGKVPIVDEMLPPGTENVPIPLSGRLDGSPVSETDVVVSWWSGAEQLGEERVSVRRGAVPDEVTVVLPAPAPKVEWPTQAEVAAVRRWFSAPDQCSEIKGGKPIEYYAKLKQKGAREQALSNFIVSKRAQLRLLGFRPADESSDSALLRVEETFDRMVASLAGRRTENGRSGSLPASAEAFKLLLPDGKDYLDYVACPSKAEFEGFVKTWWKDECRPALSGRNDSFEALSAAKARWNGVCGARRRSNSLFFAEAYVHVLCCNGCSACHSFHDGMLAEKTFENRRRALFTALMLSKEWNWGAIPPPTEPEVEDILKKFAPPAR